jgi:rod shape-determining protein MreD
MNWLRVMLLLLLAFVGVFAQATVELPRRWLGAQFSVLPAVVVCAAVSADITTVTLVAIVGGLWLDALSANPLGVSVLPLFFVGFLLNRWQDLVLREVAYAQSVLGLLATVGVTLMKLVLLFTLGEHPLLVWGMLWQLLVVGAGGAVLTPLVCRFVEMLTGLFAYQPESSSAFRADREIKRGRT